MARRQRIKITKGFSNILFIMGIVGTTALVIQYLGIITFASIYPLLVQTLLLGIGFLIEGGIRFLLKYFDNGLSQKELAHILTIVIGGLLIFIAVSGLIAGTIGQRWDGLLGASYIMALFVLIYERYWI